MTAGLQIPNRNRRSLQAAAGGYTMFGEKPYAKSAAAGSAGILAIAQSTRGEAALPAPRTSWATWERHRRSREISKKLGATLLECDISGLRLKRYAICSVTTLWSLRSRGTEVLIAQVPSIGLAVLASVWSRLFGIPLFLDAHNAAVRPEGRSAAFARKIYAWIFRSASGVVVSNPALAQDVEQFGGRPIVLPDPVPDWEVAASVPSSRQMVMFVASWKGDEPLGIVPEVALRLGPNIQVCVSGKPDLKRFPIAQAPPPNLELLGYLPDQEYRRLLTSADAVVVLTTRSDCLVCGAYEALGAGRPLILSSHVALRRHFGFAAEFCENSPEDVTRAIARILENRAEYERLSQLASKQLREDWQVAFNEFRERLTAAHGRSRRGNIVDG